MELTHKHQSYWKSHDLRYHSVVEMTEDDLKIFITKLTRIDVIEWLMWNDPNGIYSDESSLREFGSIMTYDEGVEILIRQAEENRVLQKLKIV